jgi:hypothetical protein
MEKITRTIKKAYLWKNGLGWIHLVFEFEEGDNWSFGHINEGLNFEILNCFLGCCDSINTFVGKTITLTCKYPECLQDGIIEFDTVGYWDKKDLHIVINIDKKKEELRKKYQEFLDLKKADDDRKAQESQQKS